MSSALPTDGSILLTSRAAIRCARRAHNDHDPALDSSQWVDIEPSHWAQQGIEFEAAVRAHLRDALGNRVVDLSDLTHSESTARTISAMGVGIPVIIGGALPDDPAGGRRGRPDLLVSTGPRPDGIPGYLPADIKSHVVTKAAALGSAQATHLHRLSDAHSPTAVARRGAATGYRFNDLMQLAHYWRMLEAAGHASHLGPLAGLIGSDTFTDEPWLLWQRLDDPVFTTFSRSRGSTKRSALERYDHEFEFRLSIAEAARAESEALVRPIIVEECDSCPWHEVCLEQVGELEPSRHITSGRLGVREWNALHVRGVRTLPELASLTLDDLRLANYWNELDISAAKARQRLGDAITRAQMLMNGERLRRLTSGPIDVPRADVEVDFDIEWDTDGRIYLWGLLVTNHDGTRVASLAEWVALDDMSEAALATTALRQLTTLRDDAAATGQSFAVYHYSHPEVTMVRALLTRVASSSLPSLAEWDAVTAVHFVDLWRIMKEHFIGVKGLGLKQVAPWAGFGWQDDDPSGEASMQWVEHARHADDPAERDASRERLLQYNTDDVRATLAVRRRMAQESQANE